MDNLLTDESFIGWCRGNADITQKQYWENFEKENPLMVQHARKLVLGLHAWGAAQEMREEEEKIYRVIHPVNRKKKIYILLRAASVAAIIFAILMGGYFIKQQNKPTVFVEVTTTTGEVRKVTLPDGSLLWLNANTTVKYADRKVLLEEGEVFCKVIHDAETPFSVTTANGLTINDIGTAFSVKSYKALKEVQVDVSEGEVAINQLHLKKGQGMKMNAAGKTHVYQIDPDEMGWTDGRISLNNADLHTFLFTLQNIYGVKIKVKDQGMMNCHITASFNATDKIADILENLHLIYGISYKINQGEIVLDGKGCN